MAATWYRLPLKSAFTGNPAFFPETIARERGLLHKACRSPS